MHTSEGTRTMLISQVNIFSLSSLSSPATTRPRYRKRFYGICLCPSAPLTLTILRRPWNLNGCVYTTTPCPSFLLPSLLSSCKDKYVMVQFNNNVFVRHRQEYEHVVWGRKKCTWYGEEERNVVYGGGCTCYKEGRKVRGMREVRHVVWESRARVISVKVVNAPRVT